jgi:hypothetical protein
MSALLARLNHFFTPRSSNNQRALLIHPSILTLLVASFISGQFFLNYFNLLFPKILGYAANINPERVITLTNEERAKRGLLPLKNNSRLNEAARRKAGDMFALDYWAHNSPTGRTPWAFFKEVGYAYIFAGENLARDFNDSEAVIRAWMESPTHRENVLNENYEEIGLAVVNGHLEGMETTLVVQLFGLPRSAGAPLAAQDRIEIALPEPALASGEATSSAWFTGLLTPSAIEKDQGSKPLLSPFSLTKTMVVFAIGLVIGVLVIDLYLVSRRRLVRLSGRSLAHLTFLLFLLLAILALEPGLIL